MREALGFVYALFFRADLIAVTVSLLKKRKRKLIKLKAKLKVVDITCCSVYVSCSDACTVTSKLAYNLVVYIFIKKESRSTIMWPDGKIPFFVP